MTDAAMLNIIGQFTAEKIFKALRQKANELSPRLGPKRLPAIDYPKPLRAASHWGEMVTRPNQLGNNFSRSTEQEHSMPISNRPNKIRKSLYPLTLLTIYLLWFGYMGWSQSWHIFADWWPMSLTMILGSFVAGASAEGGAAVAFPIFTKLLHIPATEARTFGLMIQAVGMTIASLVIVTRRVKILPSVIGWVSLGGVIGMIAGSLLIPIPPPYPQDPFHLCDGSLWGGLDTLPLGIAVAAV